MTKLQKYFSKTYLLTFTLFGIFFLEGQAQLPTVTFADPTTECINDTEMITGLSGGAPTTGTESFDLGVHSGLGVTDNGDGTFDFDAAVTGAGTHTVTYEYCTDVNASTEVVVDQYIQDIVDVESGTGTEPRFNFFRAVDFTPSICGDQLTIDWQGFYGVANTNIPAIIDDFTIVIYNDVGGLPGAAIQSFSIGNTATKTPFGVIFGLDGFNYSASITLSTPLIAGNTYYASLYNNTVLDTDDDWFWVYSNVPSTEFFMFGMMPWESFDSDRSLSFRIAIEGEGCCDTATAQICVCPTVSFDEPAPSCIRTTDVVSGLSGGFPTQGTYGCDEGIYSGPGVTDNGDGTFDFDPSVTGIGTHTVTYDYCANSNAGAEVIDDEYLTDPDDVFTATFSDIDLPQFAAADFTPSICGDQLTIDWQGLYGIGNTNTASIVDDFTITIYNDVGGLPGTPIQSFSIGNTATKSIFGPFGLSTSYQYSSTITLSAPLIAGTTYYVAIYNDTTLDTDDDWAWARQMSPSTTNYSSFDLVSWTTSEQDLSLSFRISIEGEACCGTATSEICVCTADHGTLTIKAVPSGN